MNLKRRWMDPVMQKLKGGYLIHERLPSARVCEAQVLKPSVNGHCDEPNINNVAKKSTSPPSGSAKPGVQMLKSNVNNHDEPKVTNEAKKPASSPSASPKPSAQMLKSNVNGHSDEPKVTNEAKKSTSSPSGSGKARAQVLKSNVNEHCDKSKVTNEAKKSSSSSSGSGESRKKQSRKQKKDSTSAGLNIQPQAVVEANNKPVELPRPVWFSFVPSIDKERKISLPMVPARFLRVKWSCRHVGIRWILH